MWGKSGFLEIGGARLEVAFHGPAPGDAPTLVMLHEGLGCVALWRDVPARLAALTGWGVCAYSRQGYGGSDPSVLPLPLDYMTREAMDVLPDVLEAIGFEHGALLGHSDGASIAAIYAGRAKDRRVRRVVLIAPHFFTEAAGLAAIAKARSSYETGDLRARLLKYHSHVDCAFRGWCDSWMHADFEQWNIESALEGITEPVLAVQGEADPYGTLAQIDAVSLRCQGPVSRVILPDCGHAPHLEKADEVMDQIAHFLR